MGTNSTKRQDENSISESLYSDRLRELPPSAKLIVRILEDEGQLTKNQLKKESLLHRRTLEESLKRLKKSGLINLKYNEEYGQEYYINKNTSANG